MGHAHSHDHSHDSAAHFAEQVCTIGACGTLGIVAILMWWQGILTTILAPGFHIAVLLAGAVLLGLSSIRLAALWIEVGRKQPASAAAHGDCCGHHDHCHDHKDEHHHDHGPAAAVASEGAATHVVANGSGPGVVSLAMVSAPAGPTAAEPKEHGHEHAHDHEHAQAPAPDHNHDHGHDHAHGWAPWRYTLLLLPVVLYSLGLPSSGEGPGLNLVRSRSPQENLENKNFVDMALSGNEVLPLEFNTLKQAAYLPDQREQYEGKLGKLKGQFVPGADKKSFSLVRVKMTCCYADAMPLNVIIISKKDVAGIKDMQWVEVTGQIQFRKRQGHDEYLPVLQLREEDGIAPSDPPSNPYL